MKIKYLIVVLLFITIQNFVFAITDINIDDFFGFDKKINQYVFIDKKKKPETKNEIKEYKSAKKIYKLYKKNKHKRILSKYENFEPSLYSMVNQNLKKNNFETAYSFLVKLDKINKKLPKDTINSLYLYTYYKLGKYNEAIKYGNKIVNKNDQYAFIAGCYLNLNQIDTAFKYAKMEKESSKNYYLAQEIIYTILYKKKRYTEAFHVAQKLVRLKPDLPENYLKLADLEKNSVKKLNYYITARNKEQDLIKKFNINTIIINNQQQNIDNAHKKLVNYVDKPDWNTISQISSKYGTKDYWLKRQDDFFIKANECICNYNGDNLLKCFNSLNEREIRLNALLIEETKFERESEERQMLIYEQKRQSDQLDYMNLNNNYHYHYHYDY